MRWSHRSGFAQRPFCPGDSASPLARPCTDRPQRTHLPRSRWSLRCMHAHEGPRSKTKSFDTRAKKLAQAHHSDRIRPDGSYYPVMHPRQSWLPGLSFGLIRLIKAFSWRPHSSDALHTFRCVSSARAEPHSSNAGTVPPARRCCDVAISGVSCGGMLSVRGRVRGRA